MWFYGPKSLKIWNFTNKIAPKRWIPCTIFTKFTLFMPVLSLHNSVNFGCFISINNKTINNLLCCGHFQPNFWWPIATKLLMIYEKVRGAMMARSSSIIMQSLVEIERHTSVSEDKVWSFQFLMAGLSDGQLCRYCFYSWADFAVFLFCQSRWNDCGL